MVRSPVAVEVEELVVWCGGVAYRSEIAFAPSAPPRPVVLVFPNYAGKKVGLARCAAARFCSSSMARAFPSPQTSFAAAPFAAADTDAAL